MEEALRINVGCGTVSLPGYVNIDLHVQTADLIADAHALPFEDNSVDEVYSSHLLEHFSGSQQNFEVLTVLQEWFRVLKPGGVIKVNVPNLEWCLKHWLMQNTEEDRWRFPLDMIFGMQTNPGEYHKTGFDEKHLRCFLRKAGFHHIEIKDIWSHEQQCFWAEGVKP